jgi:hypothetical protein
MFTVSSFTDCVSRRSPAIGHIGFLKFLVVVASGHFNFLLLSSPVVYRLCLVSLSDTLSLRHYRCCRRRRLRHHRCPAFLVECSLHVLANVLSSWGAVCHF